VRTIAPVISRELGRGSRGAVSARRLPDVRRGRHGWRLKLTRTGGPDRYGASVSNLLTASWASLTWSISALR
jgi:hypothetical protein